MAFVNTIVTDNDIDRFGLPFRKGCFRRWTYDAIGNRYLWGGVYERPHIDDYREGVFSYFDGSRLFDVRLDPGDVISSSKEGPLIRVWRQIIEVDPVPGSDSEMQRLVHDLKEALLVYGYNGGSEQEKHEIKVDFLF